MREIDRLRADNRRLRKEMRRLSDREFRATRRAHSAEGRCVDVEAELKQCQARLLTWARPCPTPYGRFNGPRGGAGVFSPGTGPDGRDGATGGPESAPAD